MPANRKTAQVRKPAAKTGQQRARTVKKPVKKQPPRGKNIKPKSATNNRKRNPASATDTAMMLYCCAAILMLIFALIERSGNSNQMIETVTRLLHGLTGSFILPLPACLMWMGVRKFRGAEKQGMRGTDELPPLLTMLLVLTIWEAFTADKLLARMDVDDYINFIRYAFRSLQGGGAIGALLGYWAYKLSPWLSLIIALMLEFIMLSSKGYLSVRAISSGVAKTTANMTQRVKRKAETIAESRELYIDDKHVSGYGTGADVDIPDFDRRIEMKQKELQSTGRSMRIDKAKEPAKAQEPYRGEPERSRRSGQSVYEERVNIPEQKPAAAKAEPVKPAPVKPSRAAVAPVTKKPPVKEPEYEEPIYEEPVYEEPEYDEPDVSEPGDDYEMPDFVEVKKAPQQPKPSFFDKGGAGPVIRQNTEQGRTVQEARADVKPGTSIKDLDRLNSNAEKTYELPDFDLLETGKNGQAEDSSNIDRQKGQELVEILNDFNIPVKLVGVSHGPAVTRLEILPEPGIKVSRIAQYSDDIQMGLEVKTVRIEAPIPGRRAVGVEIPNTRREIVNLRDVLECPEARTSRKKLLVALGKDNGGNYVLADLAGMPHVLIAGQTGSGKSICINAIIISILYRYTPDEVRLIMVDPKMVELNVYNTIPHLLIPVVTDPQKAAGALDWAVMEMQRRYKVFKERGTKNIENYNAHLEEGEKPMPRIVVIIDELADLMMVAKHDVEESINRLAQLARAAGMHLVIATQRPSVNVITGLIKANIPTRIAFTVASGVDSNTILDCYGAEKLLGKGDMLYAAADANKPVRMQGAWVSEDEVQRVVDHISEQISAEFDEDIIDHLENAAASDADRKDKQDREANEETDPLLMDALRAVVEANQASISMLQRKLKVGYPRAGKLIDMMEQRGYVAKGEGSKARDVIITREQLDRLLNGDSGEGTDEY